MKTQKERIAYHTAQLNKVLSSHGADSEHFVHAFFTLRGEIAGIPVNSLFTWANEQRERLHAVAVARAGGEPPTPKNKIDLVSHVASVGAALQQSVIAALPNTHPESPRIAHAVSTLMAELNELVQRSPVE